MKKKSVALLLALVLVFGMAVGGTVAWLMDSTAPVVNTFTVGDIEIKLDETTGTSYKVVPGTPIAKDPKVTFEKDSEACWLFVKIEKNEHWNDKLTYTVNSAWKELNATKYPGVYYQQLSADQAKPGINYYVLAGDTAHPNGVITVSSNLSSAEMENMESAQPTLTFTAYAIQSENITSVEDAWLAVSAS